MATFLLNGCVHSPIDAKKTSVPRTEDSISKDATTKLTDKDIFGNELKEDYQFEFETPALPADLQLETTGDLTVLDGGQTALFYL